MSDHTTITIPFPGAARTSRVLVGVGVLGSAAGLIHQSIPASPGSTVAIVADRNVVLPYADDLGRRLRSACFAVSLIPIEASETGKSIETVSRLLEAFHESRLNRSSVVVAVGGGITGDIAGFAASIWMRGIPLIQIPTTLLSMVDASVGGKTGVNLRVADGSLRKNLIGAFHQPALVLVDPSTLQTLPTREYRAGLAECVKHALIADDALLEFITDNAGNLTHLPPELLTDFLVRSIRVKVNIVQQDEHESGHRVHLNLGHTFAHAIEAYPNLGLLHGEAVGLGLIAAAAVAAHLRISPPELPDRIRSLLSRIGLPVQLPPGSPPERSLLAVMHDDKKASGGRIRLVLPSQGSACRILCRDDLPESVVAIGWRALREVRG